MEDLLQTFYTGSINFKWNNLLDTSTWNPHTLCGRFTEEATYRGDTLQNGCTWLSQS